MEQIHQNVHCVFLSDIELLIYHYLLVIYRFESLYVSRIQMTIDLLPIKHQMVAILDLFFNKTVQVTNIFINEFSIKNHVKMRYYI